jgi:hypothetical protein
LKSKKKRDGDVGEFQKIARRRKMSGERKRT